MTRPPVQDSGFTLIELLMAMTILGLIMGPLCGAILIIIGTSSSTQQRLWTSHDVQMADAYFASDVKNSGSQLYDPVTQVLVRRPLSTVKPACAQPTATADSVVVTFTWSDILYDPANPVATDPTKLRDRWAWYYVARPKKADGTADLTALATLRRGYCSVSQGSTSNYSDTPIARSIGPTTPALFCGGVQEIGGAHPCTGVDQPGTVSVKTVLRMDSSQPFFVQATRRVDS